MAHRDWDEMQLLDEMINSFPELPENVIRSCVQKSSGNRAVCYKRLTEEASQQPTAASNVPSSQRTESRYFPAPIPPMESRPHYGMERQQSYPNLGFNGASYHKPHGRISDPGISFMSATPNHFMFAQSGSPSSNHGSSHVDPFSPPYYNSQIQAPNHGDFALQPGPYHLRSVPPTGHEETPHFPPSVRNGLEGHSNKPGTHHTSILNIQPNTSHYGRYPSMTSNAGDQRPLTPNWNSPKNDYTTTLNLRMGGESFPLAGRDASVEVGRGRKTPSPRLEISISSSGGSSPSAKQYHLFPDSRPRYFTSQGQTPLPPRPAQHLVYTTSSTAETSTAYSANTHTSPRHSPLVYRRENYNARNMPLYGPNFPFPNERKESDLAYVQALLVHQNARLALLQRELDIKKDYLSKLKTEVLKDKHLLGEKLQGSESEETKKVCDDIIKLRVECHCLQAEVDIYKEPMPLGVTDFYRNIYSGQDAKPRTSSALASGLMVATATTLPPEVRSSPGASPGNRLVHPTEEEEEEESRKWRCSECTFENHPALNKCEMCETDRILFSDSA